MVVLVFHISGEFFLLHYPSMKRFCRLLKLISERSVMIGTNREWCGFSYSHCENLSKIKKLTQNPPWDCNGV